MPPIISGKGSPVSLPPRYWDKASTDGDQAGIRCECFTWARDPDDQGLHHKKCNFPGLIDVDAVTRPTAWQPVKREGKPEQANSTEKIADSFAEAATEARGRDGSNDWFQLSEEYRHDRPDRIRLSSNPERCSHAFPADTHRIRVDVIVCIVCGSAVSVADVPLTFDRSVEIHATDARETAVMVQKDDIDGLVAFIGIAVDEWFTTAGESQK